MVRRAGNNGAVVIGDVIPGHSGKGADFRLAERGYRDYPALYHMVEIQPKDWTVLPDVPAGKDSINLKPTVVDQLKARGYIVGQLPRTIFYEKNVKETDWSATDAVAGSDGKIRRWVYLHYFKEGQPTFNWLDPAFAAQRLVAGDALHSLGTLGERMLRLDANGFLGIEIGPNNSRAWSEGHPLSITSNQLIAGLVRKLGGFTFQELNLTLEDTKAMSQGGAGSLLRLRHSPRLPPRPRHRRCRVPASHAGAAEDLPDRSGRPHPRPAESRRAHPRAGALLDTPQGRPPSPSAARA